MPIQVGGDNAIPIGWWRLYKLLIMILLFTSWLWSDRNSISQTTSKKLKMCLKFPVILEIFLKFNVWASSCSTPYLWFPGLVSYCRIWIFPDFFVCLMNKLMYRQNTQNDVWCSNKCGKTSYLKHCMCA